MNCLGLPNQKIKCLRDLDATHIPLLEKFYHEGVIYFAFIFKMNLILVIYKFIDMKSIFYISLEQKKNNVIFFQRENLAKIFNTDVNKIRAFVHYQPTFYYFHVHYLSIELESSSIQINRAHDLFGVIQNLKLDSYYYKKIDIKYVMIEGGLLYNYIFDKEK